MTWGVVWGEADKGKEKKKKRREEVGFKRPMRSVINEVMTHFSTLHTAESLYFCLIHLFVFSLLYVYKNMDDKELGIGAEGRLEPSLGK